MKLYYEQKTGELEHGSKPKYLVKIPTGNGKYRYFYSQEEYDAYQRDKKYEKGPYDINDKLVETNDYSFKGDSMDYKEAEGNYKSNINRIRDIQRSIDNMMSDSESSVYAKGVIKKEPYNKELKRDFLKSSNEVFQKNRRVLNDTIKNLESLKKTAYGVVNRVKINKKIKELENTINAMEEAVNKERSDYRQYTVAHDRNKAYQKRQLKVIGNKVSKTRTVSKVH